MARRVKAKDFRRVRILLVLIMFLNIFLIINSQDFRMVGFIFLAIASLSYNVYVTGRIV